MRVFKTRYFARFARQESIFDETLAKAIRDAESGIIAAELGGGLIKLRVARSGGGKRGAVSAARTAWERKVQALLDQSVPLTAPRWAAWAFPRRLLRARSKSTRAPSAGGPLTAHPAARSTRCSPCWSGIRRNCRP